MHHFRACRGVAHSSRAVGSRVAHAGAWSLVAALGVFGTPMLDRSDHDRVGASRENLYNKTVRTLYTKCNPDCAGEGWPRLEASCSCGVRGRGCVAAGGGWAGVSRGTDRPRVGRGAVDVPASLARLVGVEWTRRDTLSRNSRHGNARDHRMEPMSGIVVVQYVWEKTEPPRSTRRAVRT